MPLPLRSKSGCLKCRQRRVKCDETHPRCLRCQKGNLKCMWEQESTRTRDHLQLNTTVGDAYARLFLLSGRNGHVVSPNAPMQWLSRPMHISSGFASFRNDEEQRSMVNLSSFLSSLCLDSANSDNVDHPLSVALSENWVRDSVLAFATMLTRGRSNQLLALDMQPYYTSACQEVSRSLRNNFHDLHEAELEKLLVAVQFLGMVEIYTPDNRIFPVLHFDVLCWLLEALHSIQYNKTLSPATIRFHRIALESHIYHVTLQFFFHTRDMRCTIHRSLLAVYHDENESTAPNAFCVSQDMRSYIALHDLTYLSRLSEMNTDQLAWAVRIREDIYKLDHRAVRNALLATDECQQPSKHFWILTGLAASALLILSAKVLDRSLVASSPSIRPLLEVALERLEKSQMFRKWSGDYCWIFTILFCAVHTKTEGVRLSQKLQEVSEGFWGADLKRFQKVLAKVRAKRVAMLEDDSQPSSDAQVNDTLNLLTGGRLLPE